MSNAETIVSEAAQGGTLLAYQVGVRYPRFAGVNREDLATCFDDHGFAPVAKRLRATTEEAALAHVCGRHTSRTASPGASAKGLTVIKVKAKLDDHLLTFVICRASEAGAEDVEHKAGARVFACPAGLYSAGPANGSPEDPECRALANDLVARAKILATTCDLSTVSKALTIAINSVAAYPFLSKGAYILRADDATAKSLVGLYRALRTRFYDENKRAGLQAGVAEIAGHGNMPAVSDAVVTDAEEQIVALAAMLEEDRGNSKLRPGTLAKHRAKAQAILDSLRPIRVLLGQSAERVERLTRGVLDSYAGAVKNTDLAFPEWLVTETADLAVTTVTTADDDVAPIAADDSDEPDPFDL